VDALFVYTEFEGIAVANVAKGKIVAATNGGEIAGITSIKAHHLDFSYNVHWAELGKQLIYGAYDHLTKQGGDLPSLVNVKGEVMSIKNADDFTGIP